MLCASGALVSADMDQSQRGNSPSKTHPFFSSDLFASVGVTGQLGQFRKRFADHTLVDLRLDCGAVRVRGGGVWGGGGGADSSPPLEEDRGNLTLSLSGRQQVRDMGGSLT